MKPILFLNNTVKIENNIIIKRCTVHGVPVCKPSSTWGIKIIFKYDTFFLTFLYQNTLDIDSFYYVLCVMMCAFI